MYVFDPSSFLYLFEHYYQNNFPTLWNLFDQQVQIGKITSVRLAIGEIEYVPLAAAWANNHKNIFSPPSGAEAQFVHEIYKIRKFREGISEAELLNGVENADPFVVAKGKICNSTIVTQQEFKPNSSKITNICSYFSVNWCTIKQFMDMEKWRF